MAIMAYLLFLVFLLHWTTALSFAEFAQVPENSYKVQESTIRKNTTGISFILTKSVSSFSSANNKEVTDIAFSLDHIDEFVTHVFLKDAHKMRWEVPELCEDYKHEYFPGSLENAGFRYTVSPFTFSLNVMDKQFVELFKHSLKYFDKYIEFDVGLQTNRLFGLGERAAHFALPPGTYTIWNHGQPNPFDDGKGGHNLYSSHPFYISQLPEKDKFFAIFFKNSNAQDAIISENPNKQYQVTHKTVGGVIELFVFYPSTMEHVLQKYHTLIGKPYLPAFWSVGSQQCRWGYRSIWDLKRILRNYDYYGIPLDALTVDIDYMHEYEIFTVDGVRYPGFIDFAREMHKKDLSLVLILDPGIRIKKGYHIYDAFVEKKAVIRSAKHPPFAAGNVWPGYCVFPDFFNAVGVELWKKGLKELYELAEFDGLMLDMLDIESFCNGECHPKDAEQEKDDIIEGGECVFNKANHPIDEFDDLPYYPGGASLERGTLSNTGYHCAHNSYEDMFLKEYNTHNLFSYNETKISSEYYVTLTGKRPFMLPRSTVPGAGRYASHWQGDNWATWSHLRLSVGGLFSFQLFGVPHVGSDICGFTGNSDAELCARWYQVGAFYTFTRNHNVRTDLPQEPWWYLESSEDNTEKTLVLNTAKNALRQKYSLLRLYYTRMIEVHLNGGYVVGPAFFEFPEDDTAFAELENSIMVGKAVLVSLALYPKQKTIDQYFPNSDWYELRTGKRMASFVKGKEKGNRHKLEASFDYNNMHLRGGCIIPYQDTVTELNKIIRAKHLLNQPISLLIGLNTDPGIKVRAAGTVIVDDGITAGLKEKHLYKKYDIIFTEETGTSTILFKEENGGYNEKFANELIKRVKIYGLDPMKAYRGAALKYKNHHVIPLNAAFDRKMGVAVIEIDPTISMEEIEKITLLEMMHEEPALCDHY